MNDRSHCVRMCGHTQVAQQHHVMQLACVGRGRIVILLEDGDGGRRLVAGAVAIDNGDLSGESIITLVCC